MTTWTRASRILRAGLVACALIAILPISATASGRPELKRIAGAAVSGALRQRPQAVVLKMSGDPVAVVRSRAPGKQLQLGQREAIERDLRSKQDAIVPSIQRLGGTVLGQFQHALNGIKVRGTPEQIRAFAALPGVIAVKTVRTYHLVNAHSVPFIGAPQVWQGPPGLHGEHIRIAVIDTGVDYTHANFGGPGTVAAFNAASASSTQPADPALFGPGAPKVKGGIDLVGDAYNADDPNSVPMPDPNPLDCNGHGSHTSGTVTGFGVTADGKTFTGPYDASTPDQSFIIGPGVAPLADLYAVRVFGCTGSTNVVVDAIDWAVAHDVQVISMSLGSDFGSEDDADAEASENAISAGVVVVASAGNAGPIPYVVGDPSTGEGVISVAAMDSHQFLANGVHIALSSGGGADGVDANAALPLPAGSVPAVILTSGGHLALGCSASDYPPGGAAGALVIVSRGSCTFVAKATLATAAGAVAIGVVNNASGFFNPAIPGVTIPFIELQQQDASTFAGAPAPDNATVAFASIPNATFRAFAGFSSGGPRGNDAHLKPDISAPGVSIFSTAIGTGNQGESISGTSMAAPHVAGSVALAIQAHPDWGTDEIAHAIVNTADATQLVGYAPRAGGNGLVQPFGATQTSVTAHAPDGEPSVSFGVAELTHDFSGERTIVVENWAHSPASFALSVVQAAGAPHTATLSASSITLGGHERRAVELQLSVPVATVGDSSAFREVQGRVVFTPTGGNNGVTLSVPYYLVPRARSLVDAHILGSEHAASVNLHNLSSAVTGTADFYAWGLRGGNRSLGTGLRAVGVQSFTDPVNGQVLVFAVNTFGRSSNPLTNVYDIFVDVNGDGVPDYDIEAADLSHFTGASSLAGVMVVAVFNLSTGAGSREFVATAPTDGTTVLLPLVAADAGVTAGNPRFSYVAQTRDRNGDIDTITTAASFNAFSSSISTGAFVTLPPGMGASVPLVINRQEFQQTPALGQMVVSLENRAPEGEEALLLGLED